MFTIDFIRAYNGRAPIFCISFADYDANTGYVGCTGLFYKVERRIIEDSGNIKEKYEISPWFH